VGVEDRLSVVQLDKLLLETESLRRKAKWELFYSRIPLFSTVIPLLALLIGFVQYQRQQSKALVEQQQQRAAQIRNQLRQDMDELFRFSSDEHLTIGRVSYLLDDIKVLTASGVQINDESKKEFGEFERKATKAFLDHVVYDADFGKNPKDALFAFRMVLNWKDYSKYLEEENPDTLRRILNNYVKAMQDFKQKNESFMLQVRYDGNNNYTSPPQSERIVFQHFFFILSGFKAHLDLTSNQDVRKRSVEGFEASICPNNVSRGILDKDFVDCPKPVTQNSAAVASSQSQTKGRRLD